MESAKEKAIREAYEVIMHDKTEYSSLKPYIIAETGIIKSTKEDLRLFVDISMLEETDDNRYRPKPLQGIETNNGWTRIESEADLPTEGLAYNVFRKDTVKSNIVHSWWSVKDLYKSEFITHYRKVEPLPNPIY